MPLDPQAELVIGLVKQSGLPEFWQLTPDQAREQYLLRVGKLAPREQIFRTTKAVLETRPVYHASDAAIRGHLFCSFLALVLRKELQDRLQAAELDLEWQDVIADLDRVVETTVEQQGRRFVLRNQAPFAQEFPSLELTLTDERDEAVARRVLAPADYLGGAGAEVLARGIGPGADAVLRVYIDTSGLRAIGYRMYLFFP